MNIPYKAKPRARDFQTDAELHRAMTAYAAHYARPALKLTATYSDGSTTEVQLRAYQRRVPYTTRGGDIHLVAVDTPQYVCDLVTRGKPEQINGAVRAYSRYIKDVVLCKRRRKTDRDLSFVIEASFIGERHD